MGTVPREGDRVSFHFNDKRFENGTIIMISGTEKDIIHAMHKRHKERKKARRSSSSSFDRSKPRKASLKQRGLPAQESNGSKAKTISEKAQIKMKRGQAEQQLKWELSGDSQHNTTSDDECHRSVSHDESSAGDDHPDMRIENLKNTKHELPTLKDILSHTTSSEDEVNQVQNSSKVEDSFEKLPQEQVAEDLVPGKKTTTEEDTKKAEANGAEANGAEAHGAEAKEAEAKVNATEEKVDNISLGSNDVETEDVSSSLSSSSADRRWHYQKQLKRKKKHWRRRSRSSSEDSLSRHKERNKSYKKQRCPSPSSSCSSSSSCDSDTGKKQKQDSHTQGRIVQ